MLVVLWFMGLGSKAVSGFSRARRNSRDQGSGRVLPDFTKTQQLQALSLGDATQGPRR